MTPLVTNLAPIPPSMRAQIAHLLTPLPPSLYDGDETNPKIWWDLPADQQQRARERAKQVYHLHKRIGLSRTMVELGLDQTLAENMVDLYTIDVMHRKPRHARNFRAADPLRNGRPTLDPATKGLPAQPKAEPSIGIVAKVETWGVPTPAQAQAALGLHPPTPAPPGPWQRTKLPVEEIVQGPGDDRPALPPNPPVALPKIISAPPRPTDAEGALAAENRALKASLADKIESERTLMTSVEQIQREVGILFLRSRGVKLPD